MDRTEAIRIVHENKHNLIMEAVLLLIDENIQNARIDNDTASIDSVRINQGKIMGLLSLRDYITKGGYAPV